MNFHKAHKRAGMFLVLALFAALVAIPVAQAQVTPASPVISSSGCTNRVLDNSTTTANLGTTNDFSQYGDVGVQVSFNLGGAGTTACTFYWQRSIDGTNWGTGYQYAMEMVPNGTTTVTTNVNVTLGAVPYLKLAAITAGSNSTHMTNITVRYCLKPARKEYFR